MSSSRRSRDCCIVRVTGWRWSNVSAVRGRAVNARRSPCRVMASSSTGTASTVVESQSPADAVDPVALAVPPNAIVPLHLRRGARPRRRTSPSRSVQFTAETVDNEHLDKKKSKKCCIFHKKRVFGESDSESGDDSHGSCSSDAVVVGHETQQTHSDKAA
ncbi:unnamed protein product (mitochondrion) [Plasmodiophora brassicae]|uniref:Protein phosphatase 1 regulatory subunit 11 n=1 Tax=Plasmodiophora brassicae TaxID=37360 RepID=A0A3P3YIL3_PLABS|nr:unnamed protein product [Plasmodiophora brassicae]